MPLYGSGRRGVEGADEDGSKSEMLHFVTVNGQYQPVILAQPGEALRLRVVHGGNNDHMHVSLVPATSSADDSGSCKLLTLARDGVYLPAPRLQGGGDGRVVLAPGSRADLAVRCDGPGVYRLVSSKGAGGGDGEEDEVSFMAYLGKKTDVFEGELSLSRRGLVDEVGGCRLPIGSFKLLWVRLTSCWFCGGLFSSPPPA